LNVIVIGITVLTSQVRARQPNGENHGKSYETPNFDGRRRDDRRQYDA
jgi:hypothetical protein